MTKPTLCYEVLSRLVVDFGALYRKMFPLKRAFSGMKAPHLSEGAGWAASEVPGVRSANPGH